LRATVVRRELEMCIIVNGQSHALVVEDSFLHTAEQESVIGRLTAPMHGKIVALMVAAGEEVKLGAPLVVLEAMKMEHILRAPRDCLIEEVLCNPEQQVQAGDLLIQFASQDVE